MNDQNLNLPVHPSLRKAATLVSFNKTCSVPAGDYCSGCRYREGSCCFLFSSGLSLEDHIYRDDKIYRKCEACLKAINESK